MSQIQQPVTDYTEVTEYATPPPTSPSPMAADGRDSKDILGGPDTKTDPEPAPPSHAPDDDDIHRICHVNAPEKNLAIGFVNNIMITAKYNILTFVPRNLFEQFHRLANIYFLTISCLQLFTSLSPTSKYTTAGPLAGVVAFSMIREGFEDAKRHKADRDVNGRKVNVLRAPALPATGPPRWTEVPWSQVVVGDIALVEQGNEFPADLLLLSSTTENGACYVETCNLDGETNLKLRSAVEATCTFVTEKDLGSIKGNLQYEVANKNLYTFSGKLVLESARDPIPIDVDNILLRGAVLRNTKEIFGLVIYTGRESKQMMNMSPTEMKRSNVEKTVNSTLFLILFLQLALCAICTILMAVWVAESNDTWYLPYVITQTQSETAQGFLTFLILFNNFVPISLYVTMEFVKLFQAQFMNTDLNMYHSESDTPASCRTSNLNEELGQIQYIFSDKTGTLTRNEMEFRKCAIDGEIYGFGTTEIGLAAAKRAGKDPAGGTPDTAPDIEAAQVNRDPKITFDDPRLLQRLRGGHPSAQKIEDFLMLLAVCHSVVPEGDADARPKLVYQAESPDEAALVSAARCLGYFFCGKTSTEYTVEVATKGDRKFRILALNKFNSTRKRMSVIVRDDQGQHMLLCKGADNVILERLAPGASGTDLLLQQLAGFGTEGLRTLVLSKRNLDEGMVKDWLVKYNQALTALKDREGCLERVAEEIEVQMEVVGATAIEDKLQIGVPKSIATLAAAGLKIWVLTGDKEETAINIGFACQLLTDDMEITIVNADTEPAVRDQIQFALKKNQHLVGTETEHLALVIDGKALSLVNDHRSAEEGVLSDLGRSFLTLARMSKAVIACRVSPKQKEEIVRLVKVNVQPPPMTLAIGDGANDVSMIQAAHVGVGISGNEGMQAVRAADYAIAQFRFLSPLLLHHGRCNYKRISIVILYSFYKNCALVMTLFFFCLFNGYSGATLVDSLLTAGYNVVWTSLPIVVLGVLDRDVSVHSMMHCPSLYAGGILRVEFNRIRMIRWLLNAILHAAILYCVACYAHLNSITNESAPGMAVTVRRGEEDSYTVQYEATEGAGESLYMFGTTVANILAVVVNLRLALEMNNWTGIHIFIVIASIISFFLVVLVLSAMAISQLLGSAVVLYGSGLFWLLLLAGSVACIFFDIIVKYVEREFMPTPGQIVQEQEMLQRQGVKVSPQVIEMASPTSPALPDETP